MSTSTPAASVGATYIREVLVQTARAMHPKSDAAEIAQRVACAEQVINAQLQASPNWEVYFKNSKEMREARLAQLSPDERQLAETICAEIEGRKDALKRREMLYIDYPELAPPGSLEDRTQVMMQEARTAGIQVHSQTCKTCTKRNYSFITETGELKHLLKRCKDCKTAIYCSVECQRKDWPHHKAVECLSNRP